MQVRELANENVVTIGREASLLEAVDAMHSNHVGDLVVVASDNSGRRPVGIVTDRDLVMAISEHGLESFGRRAVADEMSETLIMARRHEPIDEVVRNMRDNGIRRVPVVDDDDHLTGILTFDDVIGYFADGLMNMAELVQEELGREITGGDARRTTPPGGEMSSPG